MTVTPEQILESSGGREQAIEELVAAFLFAVTAVAAQSSVRKTTLAALLDAAEETGEDLGVLLDVLVSTNLTDALLGMRERGIVSLNDDGFSLVDQTHPPRIWDSLADWLMSLVGRKLTEWRLISATA